MLLLPATPATVGAAGAASVGVTDALALEADDDAELDCATAVNV